MNNCSDALLKCIIQNMKVWYLLKHVKHKFIEVQNDKYFEANPIKRKKIQCKDKDQTIKFLFYIYIT